MWINKLNDKHTSLARIGLIKHRRIGIYIRLVHAHFNDAKRTIAYVVLKWAQLGSAQLTFGCKHEQIHTDQAQLVNVSKLRD